MNDELMKSVREPRLITARVTLPERQKPNSIDSFHYCYWNCHTTIYYNGNDYNN